MVYYALICFHVMEYIGTSKKSKWRKKITYRLNTLMLILSLIVEKSAC